MGEKIPTESLLKDLQRVDEIAGSGYTKEEYKIHGEFSDSSVARRFGSFNLGKIEAGVKVNRRGDRSTHPSAKSRKKRVRQVKEEVGCEICGYDKYYGSLHFHHINPNMKNNSVSHLAQRGPWGEVLEEMRKCVILCANCHREVEDGRAAYK